MVNIVKRVLVLLLVLQLSVFTWVPRVSSADKEAAKNYLSKVRFSAMFSSEERQSFYIDYLFPLYFSQDDTTLLFFNPKQTWNSPRSDEYNLGIGLRKIFNDKFILGAHVFYDSKFSVNKVRHNQVGYGLEFLSQPFDFRFNYYNPITDAQVVDDSYGFGQTNIVAIHSLEEPLPGLDFEFGVPMLPKKINTRVYLGGFFYNSDLGKDVNGFRARTETNINKWLAIDTVFNNRNSGETEFIGGLRVTIPLELGRLLQKHNPLKTVERPYLQDRLLERVVRDIDVQSSASSQTEKVNDVNIIYVNNTNEGLEDGTLAHPWNTLAEALLDPRYDEGMYVYVFKGDGTTNGYMGNYTLLDDVVLWGSGYNGGFEGLPTSGFPLIDGDDGDVITLGNDDTVMGLQIQNGDYGIYASNVSGVNIIHNNIIDNGAGIGISNIGSANLGFNIIGNTISDNDTGIYVVSANSGILQDVNIIGNDISGNPGLGTGIDALAVNGGAINDFNISGNTIQDNGGGGIYAVAAMGGAISDFTISGNTISGNNGDGIYAYAVNYGTLSDFAISGNTIEGNRGAGINLGAFYYSNFEDVDILGNKIADNGVGIVAEAVFNSALSGFDIAGNTVSGSLGPFGILVEAYYGGFASDINISDNKVTGNAGDGIVVLAGPGALMTDFEILNNQVLGNGVGPIGPPGIPGPAQPGFGDGIFIMGSDADMNNFDISGNTVSDNTGNGIAVEAIDSDLAGFTISENKVSNNGVIADGLNGAGIEQLVPPLGEGIVIFTDNSVLSAFNITNNQVTDNLYDGIGVACEDESELSGFNISGNTVANNGMEGIFTLIYDYSSATNFNIANNKVTGNDGDGIAVLGIDDSTLSNFNISGNTITGNGSGTGPGPAALSYGNGILIVGANGSDLSNFMITHNIIKDNGTEIEELTGGAEPANGVPSEGVGDGILIVGTNESDLTNFEISDNIIKDNHGYGIYIDAEDDIDTISNFNITGNTISGNGEGGVYIYANYATVSDFNIEGNTITKNDGDGLTLYNSYSDMSNFNIAGNTIKDNNGAGVVLESYSYGGFDNIVLGDFEDSDTGYNAIYDNEGPDVVNYSGLETLLAENNYWGGGEPTVIGGEVDFDPYLTAAP